MLKFSAPFRVGENENLIPIPRQRFQTFRPFYCGENENFYFYNKNLCKFLFCFSPIPKGSKKETHDTLFFGSLLV